MTVNRTRVTVIAGTGAAAAIALTACSSSGSTGSGSPSTPPPPTTSTSSSAAQQQPAGPSKPETATETEFHIALSTTKLTAGTWTFHVKNAGTITHALTVDGPGVNNKSTSDISPGSSATLTVTLKAGSYEIFCPVGNHKMEGMDEKVQVS